MAPQYIWTSLKQGRAACPSRSAPSSPIGGKTKPGQAFSMATHSTAQLETWHICVMTKGFDAACPGDVTNTVIAIAPDKSAGSFRHQNRPKLPCFDSILPQPATCTKCSISLDKALPCLPTIEIKTDDSVDSVIDIKRLTQEEQALLVSKAFADDDEWLSTASDPLPENPQTPVTPSALVSTRFSSEDYALWLKFCTDGTLSDSDASIEVDKPTDEVHETSMKVASRTTVLPAITESGLLPITDFGRSIPVETVENLPLAFTLPIVLAAVKPLNIIKKTAVCTADTSALSTILTNNARLIAEKYTSVKPAMRDVPLSSLPQPMDIDCRAISSSKIDIYREPLKDVSNMPRRPGSIRNLIHKVKKQRGHRSDKENCGPPSRAGRSSSVSSSRGKLQSGKFHARGISSSASLQACT